MALLTRKRVILVETESSYGSDPTPTGADALIVSDLSITPQASDVVNRDTVRPYLGASEQLLANTRVECTFSVELAGSGTAGTAPRWGKALKACGMSETSSGSGAAGVVTYAPVSASFSSVTIYYMLDGVRHKVTGCRGSASISASVGEIPSLDFNFTGVYVAPDDQALPTVSYGAQATPLVFKNGNSTGFQLLSYAGALQSVSLDLGNSLVYRELVGGTKEVLLTDRAVTGSVSIEAVTMATKNFFAAALTDATLGNLQFTHGTGSAGSANGNSIKVASTKVDIGDVSYGEQDGIAMLEIPYTAVPSTAGNDEFSIVQY